MKHMETITIQLKDSKKATLLIEILNSIDFVSNIKLENNPKIKKLKNKSNIKELKGIWKDRDISLSSIRKTAWRNL